MTATERRLKVAAVQFAGSAAIGRNLKKILAGIVKASRAGAGLVLFHEGALSGYAGVDLDSPARIDRAELAAATKTVAAEARKRRIFVAFGTTDFSGASAYNTLRLLGSCGRTKAVYHKRGMYVDDAMHYAYGTREGVYPVAGFRVGLRLCFEFRFPEYFRELLAQNVDLALAAFCMVGEDDRKLAVARSHLASRAAENGLWLLAANSARGVQNCPTCLVDPDGRFVAEAPPDREAMIAGTIEAAAPSAVRQAILAHARELLRHRSTSR